MDIFSPLQAFADLVTYQLLSLAPDSYLASALNFFTYDVLKIGILLIVINYAMAILRYYLPLEKVRDILSNPRWHGGQYLLAALLGVVTPFCSCSSIPLFVGFLGAGIPLGVIFTFLITSPLVNEASLYLFPSVIGLNHTILYNFLGILIGIGGGLLIEKLSLERFVEPAFRNIPVVNNNGIDAKRPPVKELLKLWWDDGMGITKSIIGYVVIGVLIGALIHGFVPTELIQRYLSTRSWWVVPVSALLGVPLYANSISVVPVIEALLQKGVLLGPALTFMTATVTLSIPEALMLKKVLKWQLLALFYVITFVGIISIGLVFTYAV